MDNKLPSELCYKKIINVISLSCDVFVISTLFTKKKDYAMFAQGIDPLSLRSQDSNIQ